MTKTSFIITIDEEASMTEQEAKTRSCPRVKIFTLIRSGPGCCGLVGIDIDNYQDDFNCIGSACRMWVWTDGGPEGNCKFLLDERA